MLAKDQHSTTVPHNQQYFITDDEVIMQRCCDCSGDISVYGALKRLCEWNEASIQVMTSANVGNASSTFTSWANSLHVSVTSADSVLQRLPLWHGNLLIYGFEVGLLHVIRSVMLILGLHRISYPAPAPAEIRPNFHIFGYGRQI